MFLLLNTMLISGYFFAAQSTNFTSKKQYWRFSQKSLQSASFSQLTFSANVLEKIYPGIELINAQSTEFRKMSDTSNKLKEEMNRTKLIFRKNLVLKIS